MQVLGIVGGIGSGKTTIANKFAAYPSTYVINTDDMVEGILSHPDIQIQMHRRWEKILDPNLESGLFLGIPTIPITKSIASKIVFRDTNPETFNAAELRFLEDITLRPLLSKVEERLFYYDNEQTNLVVLDCPMLFESGMDKFCDKIACIQVLSSQRCKRASNRSFGKQLSENEFKIREKLQWSIDEKTKKSDYLIANDDGFNPDAQIKVLWERIVLSKDEYELKK